MKYNELKLVDLKKIAKEKNIKGYSKFNKEKLIFLLNKHDKYKKGGGEECKHNWEESDSDNYYIYYNCLECGKEKKICNEHNWEESGSDNNYIYYKCLYCISEGRECNHYWIEIGRRNNTRYFECYICKIQKEECIHRWIKMNKHRGVINYSCLNCYATTRRSEHYFN